MKFKKVLLILGIGVLLGSTVCIKHQEVLQRGWKGKQIWYNKYRPISARLFAKR